MFNLANAADSLGPFGFTFKVIYITLSYVIITLERKLTADESLFRR